MDRESLQELIRKGPVRLEMNDGQVYEIPSSEFALVDDLHAYVMYRSNDGRLRTKILSLVCTCSAETMAEA